MAIIRVQVTITRLVEVCAEVAEKYATGFSGRDDFGDNDLQGLTTAVTSDGLSMTDRIRIMPVHMVKY